MIYPRLRAAKYFIPPNKTKGKIYHCKMYISRFSQEKGRSEHENRFLFKLQNHTEQNGLQAVHH